MPSSQAEPSVSRDGRWIVYSSLETGKLEVYVQPFHCEGERVLVSVGGGDAPVWSGDGRSLLYRHGSQLVEVDVLPGEGFHTGGRRGLQSVMVPRAAALLEKP